jgi:hypothetical protein
MCSFGNLEQQPMKDLIKALGQGDELGFNELNALSSGCPVCILSAINQSGLQRGASFDLNGECTDGGFYIREFDFKKSKEQFFKDYRAE